QVSSRHRYRQPQQHLFSTLTLIDRASLSGELDVRRCSISTQSLAVVVSPCMSIRHHQSDLLLGGPPSWSQRGRLLPPSQVRTANRDRLCVSRFCVIHLVYYWFLNGSALRRHFRLRADPAHGGREGYFCGGERR